MLQKKPLYVKEICRDCVIIDT